MSTAFKDYALNSYPKKKHCEGGCVCYPPSTVDHTKHGHCPHIVRLCTVLHNTLSLKQTFSTLVSVTLCMCVRSTEATSAAPSTTAIPVYNDCQDVLDSGHGTDGVYNILVDGNSTEAFCDLNSPESDGEGFIVRIHTFRIAR